VGALAERSDENSSTVIPSLEMLIKKKLSIRKKIDKEECSFQYIRYRQKAPSQKRG
jgi:hypothetical protein